MTIKLFNIAKELNVGVGSLSEFLKGKNFEIEENNPNARVGIKELDLLMNEFGKGLSKDEHERIYNKFVKPKAAKKAPEAAAKDKDTESKTETKAEKTQHIPTKVPEINIKVKGTLDETKKADSESKAEAIEETKVEAKAKNNEVEAPVAEKKTESKEPENTKKETLSKPNTDAEAKAEPKVEQPKAERKAEAKQSESKQEAKAEEKPKASHAPKAEEAKKETEVKPKEVKVTAEAHEEKKQPNEKQKKASSEAKTSKEQEAKADASTDKSESKKAENAGVYRINTSSQEPQVKVIGKIDLDSINSSTRPKKKSKEDKQSDRKKRKRINTAAVDVNQVGAKVGAEQTKRPANPQQRNAAGGAGGRQGGAAGGSRKQSRRSPVVKPELSDEEIQKTVKDTIAKLTSKKTGTSLGRGAKYRRDRREAILKATQDAREQRSEEASILKITEFVTVSELAIMMDEPVNKVIETCMNFGLMVAINMRLEAADIKVIAEEFGFETEFVSADVVEAIGDDEDSEEDLKPRQAVVTVMGHVDHGKSSLLDYLRKSNVIAEEAGGITQHLGAYVVKLKSGRKLTMLDTPGHEAFTAMRARGAKVADIAIIIIAANDRVMPQTEEAINHATAAGVPIVFAINKIDTTGANPEKIKEQLANLNFLVEDWGGKYQCQEISAKHGTNIDELLEKIMLEAEILDLKANPDRNAAGTVLQSSLDKGRGYVSKLLVQNGTLNVGDFLLAGNYHGRVRAMYNEHDKRVKTAGPSTPVLVLGLNGAPSEGDSFNVMDTEHEVKEIAQKREQLQREQQLRTHRILTLEDISHRRAIGNFQELNLIVKGDVGGSVEALSDSLIKLSTEEIQVNVIHKGVGEISQSDIVLASASNAVVIGFQVRPSVDARRLAESEGVEIRSYSIIYDTINEVKAAMEGMLAPEIREEITATLEVLQVFKITKVGTIAGCLVKEGKIKRSNKVRLIRNGIVIHSGELGSLKRFKDDAKEVVSGLECGLDIANYDDIVEGDIIEAYEEIEIKKKL